MRPIANASTVYLMSQAVGYAILNNAPRLNTFLDRVTGERCNCTVLRDGIVQRAAGLIQTLGTKNYLFGENSAALAPLACQAFVDNPLPVACVLLRKSSFILWLAHHIPLTLSDSAIPLALSSWAIKKVLFSDSVQQWARQQMDIDLSVRIIEEWIDYGLSGAPTPSLQQACEYEASLLRQIALQEGTS